MSVALMAMAMDKLGVPAVSLNAFQVSMHTTSSHGNARLKTCPCCSSTRSAAAVCLGNCCAALCKRSDSPAANTVRSCGAACSGTETCKGRTFRAVGNICRADFTRPDRRAAAAAGGTARAAGRNAALGRACRAGRTASCTHAGRVGICSAARTAQTCTHTRCKACAGKATGCRAGRDCAVSVLAAGGTAAAGKRSHALHLSAQVQGLL